MFQSLSDRLSHSLRSITGKARLTEDNIQDTMREVRMALLEADVALPVVKEFVEAVKARALGQEVMKSLSPGQAFLKIVQAELEALMGSANEGLNLATTPPAVIMMAGLQGAGKTTTVAKLARLLIEREKKKVMVVSADVYRPAAIKQLETLSSEVGAEFFPSDIEQKPVAIVEAALAHARIKFSDVLIVDTAGRLAVDEAMMGEAAALVEAIDPGDVVYVADALAGQDAVNTVSVFHERLPLTGTILTKLDGDARGGVAMSIVAVTGLPILYVGVGERFEDLEAFHPERIASRILGMGDVLTLIEKAQEAVDVEQAAEMEKRLRDATFTLEDFREQMRQMNKLGSMSKLLEMLPMGKGIDTKALAPAEDDMRRFGAIIDSMTADERRHPQNIDGSRRRRIAAGSGTRVQDVNQLLKQFNSARKLMKKLGRQRGNPLDMMRPAGFGP